MDSNVKEVLEKVASVLEGDANEVTLSKEDLQILTNVGQGMLDGLKKEAEMAVAEPIPLTDLVEAISDDEEAMKKLAEELEEFLPENFEKTAESMENLVVFVSPISNSIVSVAMGE